MSAFRSAARRLAAPAIELIDRRLTEIGHRLDGLHATLAATVDRTAETEELIGRTISGMASASELLSEEVHTLASTTQTLNDEIIALRDEHRWMQADVDRSLSGISSRFDGEVARLETLDETTANYLNAATGYLGLAAQAGVFVNEPVIVHYRPGGAEITAINERIVELPFVFRALGALDPGSRILDIGSAESTVSLSLASLGYQVTAVDPRGYGFVHPNLCESHDVADLDTGFDATLAISTIEHVGIEHYDQPGAPNADIDLMSTVATKLKPGGLVLLTTPYGIDSDAGFQRIYDAERLRRLMAPFTVLQIEFAQRHGDTQWTVTGGSFNDLPVVTDDEYRVAMLVARLEG